MVQIKTERLLLRLASAKDAEALHGIFSNSRAMAFWSTLPHTNLAETQAWLAAMLDIDPAEGEDFVIEQEGRVIGKAGLYQFPELGFILHPDQWGKGYARESLEAVIGRAFSLHRLPFVEADVDPRNVASRNLLRCLGFKEAGRASRTWQIGGIWCDSVYLRLHNKDPVR